MLHPSRGGCGRPHEGHAQAWRASHVILRLVELETSDLNLTTPTTIEPENDPPTIALDLGSRPLDKAVLVSGAFAAETGAPLIPLGTHARKRGIASPCAVFTLLEN